MAPPRRDQFPARDEKLTLKGVAKPVSVKLLGDGSELKYDVSGDGLAIDLPASKRSKLVDVVAIQLAPSGEQPAGAVDKVKFLATTDSLR